MQEDSCNIDKYPELQRRYKIIVFDWDGTAVKTRKDDISSLISIFEQLIYQGIFIAVITGTNFNNVDSQFCKHIREKYKKNLFIFTNRGSEVYTFNENSEPVQVYLLKATEKENELLDKIAEKTKLDIEKISDNININIIYNRLNRRKLDLIPEWENPLKSEIDKLIVATNQKLKNKGFHEGIKGAFDLMKKNSQVLGLKNAKITSDVKHIEVGLSDKSDSVRWIMQYIAAPNSVSDQDILVLGDEFGTVAGFDGSDYKMVMNNHKDLTYFSVGKEPNGVPEGVKLIGGGPDCFLKIIKRQIILK